MNTVIQKYGFFSGKLIQRITSEDVKNCVKPDKDCIFIKNTNDYESLFSFLEKNKDKEIIFEADVNTSIEYLLNSCPRREDCFPIIDTIVYYLQKASSFTASDIRNLRKDDIFVVSDIQNLRMDDIVYYEPSSADEYNNWRELAKTYTNCNFELNLISVANESLANIIMNEDFSLTSRTRFILG